MCSTNRSISHIHLTWEGLSLSVRYEPNWLGLSDPDTDMGNAHLEVWVDGEERAALPITETGYRSHFLSRFEVDDAGGPAPYVQAWLDQAAKDPKWRRLQEAARQLSLF